MARRRSKKKSNKLLKTAILLVLFIGVWFIYNHTDIPARIQNALRPHKASTVRTVPESEVTPPKPQTGVLPPPEPVVTPPGKTVTYTIRCPQFDNLSYGVPGSADSIIEREGYALGYIEKHEQPAWVQYIMTSEEVSRRAAKRDDDFRPDPEVPTGSATPQDYTRSGYDRGHLAPAAMSGPFEPWIVWRMDAVKFPINSKEIMFIAMISSISMYCLVSWLTCRRPFNPERMLHRGRYAVDGEIMHFEKLTTRNFFKKMIGITPDYTTGDKIIAYSTFTWSFGVEFLLFFVGPIVWNSFSRWPTEGWGWRIFIFSVVLGCGKALISMFWFVIGGIMDLRQMFRDLAARTQINDLDNGMVDGNVSLADKIKFEKIECESNAKK